MREPDNLCMGYGVDKYEAECIDCGTVVAFNFNGKKSLLTLKSGLSGVEQTELYAFVFFWTIEKCRRECSCNV